MFEQTFKNVDDVLWKEAGCATELDYTEQTSWILFLKYLDDLEKQNEQKRQLEGKTYQYIIDRPHRWSAWAAPKKRDGSFDHDKALTGDDLVEFVNRDLFPYLQGFRTRAEGANTIEYKIGEIFGEIRAAIRCATRWSSSTRSASARRSRSMSYPTFTRPSSATWATPDETAANITRLAHSFAP